VQAVPTVALAQIAHGDAAHCLATSSHSIRRRSTRASAAISNPGSKISVRV
jgi:hypothetical protein